MSFLLVFICPCMQGRLGVVGWPVVDRPRGYLTRSGVDLAA